MQPLESAAPLIIYIDFKSPYAYLAIEPTRKLLAELGVVADWRPFVLNIGSYLGTAKLAKTGEVKEQSALPSNGLGSSTPILIVAVTPICAR